MNAKYSSSIIDLAQVIRLKSKAVHTILQANLLLPSIRYLQRLKAQSYDSRVMLINIEPDTIMDRLNH